MTTLYSQYAFYWNDDDRRVNRRRIDNQYIYPECRLRVFTLHQGLSKHQEVSSTPVTNVKKMIVVFWDLLGAIKR